MPIYCLGMVTDITSFNVNNIMNFRIDGTDKKTGQTDMLEHRKFYVYDEDRLLTKTETMVLSYLAEGLSSKMIAGKCKISENTIENHRQTMLRKTDTQNVAQMVAFAVRKGII